MTKQEAFDEINRIQDNYVAELIDVIHKSDYQSLKEINFTSPTGTGKTKMMSKLINKLNNYYFIVTSLSKGHLKNQIEDNLKQDCMYKNYKVYGLMDYTTNSRLKSKNILNLIPVDRPCIWLRDEGHIRTNNFSRLLENRCFKIINFSATNQYSDIKCDFTQTMMLRTVTQTTGTPEDAIKKLIEIKKIHSNIADYNPCAIFRCIKKSDEIYNQIIDLCNRYKLKYIDITNNDFDVFDICRDDNLYDIIINKQKITEGIDIRRAHVIYMDSQPSNPATTIQVIGRCRRNALLYRDDIDILADENKDLLEYTRNCYVFYNIKNMKIDTDETGELQMEVCNKISCERLKAGTVVEVTDGQLSNGLYILELENKTGRYEIIKDSDTGCNIVNPVTEFYETETEHIDNSYITTSFGHLKTDYIKYFPHDKIYYYIDNRHSFCNIKIYDTYKALKQLSAYKKKWLSKKDFYKNFKTHCIKSMNFNKNITLQSMKEYIAKQSLQNAKFYTLQQDVYDYTTITLDNIEYDFHTLCSGKIITILMYYYIKYCQSYRAIYPVSFYDYITSKLSLLYNYYTIIQTRKPDIYKLLKTQDSSKILHIICSNDIQVIYPVFSIYPLKTFFDISNPIYANQTDVTLSESQFEITLKLIDKIINEPNIMSHIKFTDINSIYNNFCYELDKLEVQIKQGIINTIDYYYNSLFKKIPDVSYSIYRYNNRQPVNHTYMLSYDRIKNDKESAILGVEKMRLMKKPQYSFLSESDEYIWIPSKNITNKINSHNKFNNFITIRYADELKQAETQYFTGRNTFNFDRRCNSAIGFCVEYYSKYLLYGTYYLQPYIDDSIFRMTSKYERNATIIHACMQKYRALMGCAFSQTLEEHIPTISVDRMLKSDYTKFVELVVDLGTKTADFVKKTLYQNSKPVNNVDPNLSIRHISGLADYITEDTILDIKVRNNIDETCIRQVLAYHYLSTKRSDLHIKKVIVYDAVSEKHITVDISDKNQK